MKGTQETNGTRLDSAGTGMAAAASRLQWQLNNKPHRATPKSKPATPNEAVSYRWTVHPGGPLRYSHPSYECQDRGRILMVSQPRHGWEQGREPQGLDDVSSQSMDYQLVTGGKRKERRESERKRNTSKKKKKTTNKNSKHHPPDGGGGQKEKTETNCTHRD
jgi:hypothetical protein